MSADRIEHWTEWHRVCALDKCDQEAQESLAAFARGKFSQYARRLDCPDSMLALPDRRPDGTEIDGHASWHYVEQRLLNGHHRSGRTYKAYIVDHALGLEPALQLASLRRGFGLQVRNVVRAYYAREVSQSHRDAAVGWLSLDASPGDDETETCHNLDLRTIAAYSSIGALSPSEQNEFRQIAAQLAPRVWEGMTTRERVVVLASVLGLPLYAPAVEAAADCKKSQIYAARKAFDDRVSRECASLGVHGDPLSIMALKLFMTLDLESELRSWASSEKSVAPLFTLAGGDKDE